MPVRIRRVLPQQPPESPETGSPETGSPEAGSPETAPQDELRWLREHWVTLAAVTLITIQLLWMGSLLAHSYFRQDDYFNFDRALASGLSWNYLMLVSAGHMAPLGFAISWALAHISLYNWALTGAVIMVMVAAASFALLRVLRMLFGNRQAILIPLAVYLFSPLAVAAVGWWSVAVQTLPLEIAIFMAVGSHVRYLREGRTRQLVATAGWLLLGMATVQKGVLIPLLLFGLTAGFFVPGRWDTAIVVTARRYWRAWLVFGVMMAAYCVLFFTRLPGSTSTVSGPGPAGRIFSFLSPLAGTTLVPGVMGGPWHWAVLGDGYAQAQPPAALEQLSWEIALIFLIASCVYRVRAWRAWAIAVGWIVAADVFPVVIGRLSAANPGLLALQPRYVTDAVSVLALCLGLAFLPLAGEPEGQGYRFRFRRPESGIPVGRAAIALLLAAFLAGSFWSLQELEGITKTSAERSYIATARAAVAQAPPGTLIVDLPTPSMIMDPVYFYRTGNTSRVIGALVRAAPDRHVRWIESPRGAVGNVMTFDAQGRLVPAAVAGKSFGPPFGGRCWDLGKAAFSVSLRKPLFRWSWTVRLNYSGPAAPVAVRLGGSWATATLPAGTSEVYVPLQASGSDVVVSPLSPAPGQCLASITVGTWQPVTWRQGIPAQPLPG